MAATARLVLIAVLCAPVAAWGQIAAPTPVLPTSSPNGLSDPTRNVLDKVLDAVTRLNDLNAALKERQDNLREADQKFNAVLRDADTKRLNELREAETRRVNELNAQKQIFDLELARVIRAGQDSSTLLLAAAVKEVKSDSSERFSKLEQFANEQRGRASGQGESYALIWAVIGAVGLIGGLLVGAIGQFRPKKPETDPELIALLREMRARPTPNGNGTPNNTH